MFNVTRCGRDERNEIILQANNWSLAFVYKYSNFVQAFCTMLQTSLLQVIAISNCLLIYILRVISYIPACLRAVRKAKWNRGVTVGARRACWPNNILPGYQSYPCVELQRWYTSQPTTFLHNVTKAKISPCAGGTQFANVDNSIRGR